MNNGRNNKIPKLRFVVRKYDEGSGGVFDWGSQKSHRFESFYAVDELDNPELAQCELTKISEADPEFIDAYNSRVGGLALANILFNGYPILLHRYNRCRIARCCRAGGER